MPPFTPKEVARFFFWIAILLLAVTAIFWMIWRAPGHQQVQPNPSTGLMVMPVAPNLSQRVGSLSFTRVWCESEWCEEQVTG